jgi:hypothetical protein
VEIVLNVLRDEDGRLTGTARVGGDWTESLPFTGNLELLAVLERLCDRVGPGTP